MTPPSSKPPTIVVVIFDQKNPKAKLLQDASSVLRYIARLQSLPGPYSAPSLVVDYVLRDDAIAAFAASGFETKSLAGMARELEIDAFAADKRVTPVLVHGTISIKVSPDQFDRSGEEFLAVGHRLMALLGVDENRYVLSVHADSEHIHLHFLYCRVGIGGALRERERKLPKFMAEEACAVLADEFGFGLEPRHLSRVMPGGVVDLASGRMTRDANFDALPSGSAARSKARMSMSGDDLRKISLVALHVAGGDLGVFRSELAEHGISYVPSGSGAHLVDVHGIAVSAGQVDSRLQLGKIKLTGVARDLPPEPPEISEQIKQRRAELVALTIPIPNPTEEWERYARDRSPTIRPLDLFASQSDWCDDDMRRAFRTDKRGRPKKQDEALQWPGTTHATGALGSPKFILSEIKFDPTIYKSVDRSWQTEFWRGSDLVATVRYNRLAIYSSKKEDLRAALLAAQTAWGVVEIFGDKKFKTKMVKLAAELGVEISNPELQAPLAEARLRLPVDWLGFDAKHADVTPALKPDIEMISSPDAERDRPGTPIAKGISMQDPSLSEKPFAHADAPTDPFLDSAIAQIDENRAPLVATFESTDRIVLLEPSEARHYQLSDAQQRNPDVQRQLQLLYDRQEKEQDRVLDAIFARQATIIRLKEPNRETVFYKVAADTAEIATLVRLHQMNLQFQASLERRWESLKHLADSPIALAVAPKQRTDVGEVTGVPRIHDANAKTKAAAPDTSPGPPTLPAERQPEQPILDDASSQLATVSTAGAQATNAKEAIDGETSGLNVKSGDRSRASADAANAADAADTAIDRVSNPIPVGVSVSVLKENTSPSDRPGSKIRNAHPDPEVERLVLSFEAAERPAEMRAAAVAIRADPIAKHFMDATKDKRWIAVNGNIVDEQRSMHQNFGKYR